MRKRTEVAAVSGVLCLGVGCWDGASADGSGGYVTNWMPLAGNGRDGVLHFVGYDPAQTAATGHPIRIEVQQLQQVSGCTAESCVRTRRLTVSSATTEGSECDVRVVHQDYAGAQLELVGREPGTATLRVIAESPDDAAPLEDSLSVAFADPAWIAIRHDPQVSAGATRALTLGARLDFRIGVEGARDGASVRLLVDHEAYEVRGLGSVLASSWDPSSTPPGDEPLPVALEAVALGTAALVVSHGSLTRAVPLLVVDPEGGSRLDLLEPPAADWVDVEEDRPEPEASVTEIILRGDGDRRVYETRLTLADGTYASGGADAFSAGPIGVVQAHPLVARPSCGLVELVATGPGEGWVEGGLGASSLRIPVRSLPGEGTP